MANPAAVAVSEALTVRNLSFLQQIWQGGNLALFDRETSPGVKQGYLNILGSLTPDSGASMQNKVKSADFVTAMATGVGIVEGKPISQFDPTIQVKLNAPSVAAVALALFAGTPSTYTQAAVAADAAKTIPNAVANVWYLLGAQAVTKFIASNTAGDTVHVAGVDYVLDTQLGAVKFLSGCAGVGSSILCSYQAAAITTAPEIAPAALPKFTYGGLYIYSVLAPNEARSSTEVWLRYMPRARVEPTGNFDIGVSKPGEITLDIQAVPSSEISGKPFGWFRQIAGAVRDIN
jgi:hypothetical protein